MNDKTYKIDFKSELSDIKIKYDEVRGYFDPEFLQKELSKVNNELNDERIWSDVIKSKELINQKNKIRKRN